MFSVILSREWTEQFRSDVMNSINLLMLKRKLDPETNYQLLTDSKGRPRVGLWLSSSDGRPIAETQTLVDPLDLITAAGALGLVRGLSDAL